ncbi:MAG TPA: cytoplasmic protein [Rhizobiaceae bacterium]|nr:cytoplasmic protein [Rhizobiaceae bacterium]
MRDFSEEIRAFKARKAEEMAAAGRLAAFRLATGIDLDDGLSAAGEKKEILVAKLKRLIERERLKGLRRHWSYDLNRHIALKQALDRIDGRRGEERKPGKRHRQRPKKQNGARGAV